MRIIGASLILIGFALHLIGRHVFTDHWLSVAMLGKLGWLTVLSYTSIAFIFVGAGTILTSLVNRQPR